MTCPSEIAYIFLLFTIKTARYVVLAFANKVYKPQKTLEKLYNVILLRRISPTVKHAGINNIITHHNMCKNLR